MVLRAMIFLPLIMLASCSGNKENHVNRPGQEDIIIRGTLRNGSGQLVTLDQMGVSAFLPIDSTRCDENGAFSFSFEGNGMNYYSLKYTEHGYITLIAEPGDSILITGSADTIYPYSIEGSRASKLVMRLAVVHKETLNRLQSISEKTEMIVGNVDFSKKKQELNKEYDAVSKSFKHYSHEFIIHNPGSPAILIALYNQFGPALPVFDPVSDFSVYQFVDSTLYKEYSENEAVKSLHSELSRVIQQTKAQQSGRHISTGDKAPDFAMKTTDNEIVTLSGQRGNYVLLQVWASWSKPAAEENRFLEECYRLYKDKNFVILQVSIDNVRGNWIDAIKMQHEGWFHVSDLLRWESAIVKLYGIEKIPANFLINPDGVIIETDIFGEELVETIKKYLL